MDSAVIQPSQPYCYGGVGSRRMTKKFYGMFGEQILFALPFEMDLEGHQGGGGDAGYS